VETARDLGIDWWSSDPFLTDRGEQLVRENEELRGRLDRLEQAVSGVLDAPEQSAGAPTQEAR